MHNGHDGDGQLALDGKLQLATPYTLYGPAVSMPSTWQALVSATTAPTDADLVTAIFD